MFFCIQSLTTRREREVMSRQPVFADTAPKAIGPYSHAIIANGFVYCSGQTPTDPATGELVAGDIKAQTHQVMKNLENVLTAAGTDFEHVVKTNIFLNSMGDFAGVNEVYASYFKGSYPARSTVGGLSLPKGALVEIEMVAMVPVPMTYEADEEAQ
jgi:2-iminobutanoate/2-iminopropanoate deaminase